MGVPQFMPGSYRTYAVDFDGDGRPDLWQSPADIVGSVANYLARHDWQPGQPVLLPATIAEDEPRRRPAQARRRSFRAPRGRRVGRRRRDVGRCRPPMLRAIRSACCCSRNRVDGVESASYWIAFNNFYVLTRYNRSRLYAAAVHELAKAIKAARGEAAAE